MTRSSKENTIGKVFLFFSIDVELNYDRSKRMSIAINLNLRGSSCIKIRKALSALVES
jgi:hypothetical protein